MIRWLLFFVLAGALVSYAFWVYLRVELSVPVARWLAVARSAALVLVLFLLFDPRLPSAGIAGTPTRWLLLDASLSMSARGGSGGTAWADAQERASSLEGDGWQVVHFGGGGIDAEPTPDPAPDKVGSALAPALAGAAEAGAREVLVLSDMRFEDAVALRSTLQELLLEISFEAVGGDVDNAGVMRFDVSDVTQPDAAPTAEVELFGGAAGDSLDLDIMEEGAVVSSTRVGAPSPGLRTVTTIELPVPTNRGRVRYSARVRSSDDAFPDDDEASVYANVGYEEGGLVVVSFRPDWEPRYLLPVLEEATGLPATGFLRAGPDRFVRSGRAFDRGEPADSATVRRAATEAALLVVHGLDESAEPWIATLIERPGRRLVLPIDPAGARAIGLDVAAPQAGEWYASPDVPTSPIAGALSGVDLQGLPPLSDVLVPAQRTSQPPLQLQLRGAGSPESAFELLDRESGRVVVALASGFWRWTMREAGREPYRRIWSGVVGWLLADQQVAAAEARPSSWVFERGAPVSWNLPGDTVPNRIVVSAEGIGVVDTVVSGGGAVTTGTMPPGSYGYEIFSSAGDTLGAGRFDVSSTTTEMLPPPNTPEVPISAAAVGAGDGGSGRPLRTSPWPYLLVIVLLCGEWIVRRRTGLR